MTFGPAGSLGLVGRRREQQPQVLVPGLVDAVRRVEPELVRGLAHVDRVHERIIRQLDVTEPHHVYSSPLHAELSGQQ